MIIRNNVVLDSPVNRSILASLSSKVGRATDISKNIGSCISHIIKKLSQLKEGGFIELIETKDRRDKYYRLTEKGQTVAILLQQIGGVLK